MSIEQDLQAISSRIKLHSNSINTEEAAKTAVVLPFIKAMGYDIFNPSEVIPEFTADAVGKKGEKVDYAIKVDEKIRILIECKPVSVSLDSAHLAQLYRYFSVTSAKFAILTNGIVFQFYSDLEEPNKLDSVPFLTFDLTELQVHLIQELKKFGKDIFDVDSILATAERLKYTSELKKTIIKFMESPPEIFTKVIASDVYSGKFTASAVDKFSGLIRSAFREIIRESVHNRLSSVLAETETPSVDDTVVKEKIHTTDEEKEAFMIIKAIVCNDIDISRVYIRDQQSYCGVLLDNNNRKPIVRFHFNKSSKYICLFYGDAEERVKIDELNNIYNYAEKIIATARKYDK